MSPSIQTFSDEINYLVWRYLRESNLAQTAWTLEAEVKSKGGKDIIALHEEVGKNLSVDLPKRLRMSLQYQEVLKHMSEDGDLPCTAPFTLLSEHTCNKGDDSRIPLTSVLERPWQLEPANFPHGEPLQLTVQLPQPRQSRRLNNNNRDDNGSNGPTSAPATLTFPPKGRGASGPGKRRKPNPNSSLPTNSIVEEEESNVDDEMDEDTVVMNGEDVVMKDPPTATSVKEPETIHVIPNEAAVQFGDVNTIVAAWNEKTLLATGQEAMVQIWNVQPRGEERLEEHHMNMPTSTAGDVTSLSWHPNDCLLAAGTFSGLTTIWNVDGSLRASMPSPHGPIFNLVFNPSGTLLVTCSASGVFEIYNTKDWSSIFKVPATGKPWEHTPNIPTLVWIDDQRLAILAPSTPPAIVNCWQFDDTHATSPFLQLVGHEGLINDIQYDRGTGFIGTASDDTSVRLWKLDKPSPYHEFKTHSAPVQSLSFRPSPPDDTPRILTSASWDGTISLYDITHLTHLHTIGNQIHNFPHDRIACVTWAPDGRFFCSGDLEGAVGVWEWRDASLSEAPRPYAIWAPERILEDQLPSQGESASANVGMANGMNGHKDDLDRPVHGIHWQKNGQSFVVCRENRKVALIDWPLEQRMDRSVI